jgi:hypothetical protein
MFGDPVIVALMTEKFISEPAQVSDPVVAIQARATGVTPSKTCKVTTALAGNIQANAAAPASKAAKVGFLIFEPPVGVPSSPAPPRAHENVSIAFVRKVSQHHFLDVDPNVSRFGSTRQWDIARRSREIEMTRAELMRHALSQALRRLHIGPRKLKLDEETRRQSLARPSRSCAATAAGKT